MKELTRTELEKLNQQRANALANSLIAAGAVLEVGIGLVPGTPSAACVLRWNQKMLSVDQVLLIVRGAVKALEALKVCRPDEKEGA